MYLRLKIMNLTRTYLSVLLSLICATVLLIILFLFLLPDNFSSFDHHQKSDQPTTNVLDMYQSEEWRYTVKNIGHCEISQFASVRQRILAQFYAQTEPAADNILVFASGCVEAPFVEEAKSGEQQQQVVANVQIDHREQQVVANLQIDQLHSNSNACIFLKREQQLENTHFSIKPLNGTDTMAFFVAAKLSRRKCFFIQSEESLFALLTFRNQMSVDGFILQQIKLPEIKLDKIGNHFVEFVALEHIHLLGKKRWRQPNFHLYRGLPVVLAWNKQFYFYPHLPFWPSGLSYDEEPNSNCPYKCIYTTDQKMESAASVLLFHVFWSNPISFWPLLRGPSRRSQEQLYTFFTLESPYNAGSVFDNLPNDWFNMSMTYHSDSSVIIPYDQLEHRNEMTTMTDLWSEEEIRQRVRQKSKLALQIVSHCGTPSGRDSLTAQLGQLIPVDVFGGCNGKECDEQCYKQEMESHFFYLAFENSVCPQYVTEKFWNALRTLTVPVVLHRKVLRGVEVPDNAYIAADDFCSVHELAQHLLALQRDTERYTQLFNWTREYTKRKWRHSLSPLCQLCEIAHKYPPQEHSVDKRKFWSAEGQCTSNFVQNDLFKCD